MCNQSEVNVSSILSVEKLYYLSLNFFADISLILNYI